MKTKRRYLRPAIQVVKLNFNGVLLTSASQEGYEYVENGWSD